MKQGRLRLLIHHHHPAYLDEHGVIWLTANIGRWADALADQLGEVGLLLYQSEQRLPQQDTPIVASNVKLYSLGPRRTVWERILRRNHLRRVCAEAGKNADVLLIRGLTPHQYAIWRSTPVAHKAFLLVGSLGQWNKKIPRSFGEALVRLIEYLRLNELRHIAEDSGTLMLANSPELVSEIERLFGKQAHFVSTNIVRKGEFASLQVRPVSKPWRLLYCGRLDLQKGLRELIQALAILNRQGQPCHLDIVGATLDPAYSELVILANELGINTWTSWHGVVPYGPELFVFYQRADVFVLPSYSEGFPKVFWEAAANCCPVITTSVGGIPALLVHEEHALLVPPKDVEAIVAAVQRLLSDDALRRCLVEQAYQLSRAFTVEACAQKLADVLTTGWS